MINEIIPQKRITALKNLSKLISHMNNKSRLDYRTIAIEKIPLNEKFLKANGFPQRNILKQLLETICYQICNQIIEVPIKQMSNSMKPGIFLGPDIAGTRTKSKITDYHIEKENVFPHIHGIIILPFELRKWQQDILIKKIKEKIELLPAVKNKSTMITSHKEVQLSPYKEKSPIWNYLDYASKLDLKNQSFKYANTFEPIIYPYGKIIHSTKTRNPNKNNRSGYDRKLNDIYKAAAVTYEQLLLEPWHFFNSNMHRDISETHKEIIVEHKISGESLINSSRKNRILYELEKDGGAYIRQELPVQYPDSVQKQFIKSDVKEFIDAVATAECLRKPEPIPDDDLIHLMASENPFSGYKTFTDWAKSYETYPIRHLMAQMRNVSASGEVQMV